MRKREKRETKEGKRTSVRIREEKKRNRRWAGGRKRKSKRWRKRRKRRIVGPGTSLEIATLWT